MANRRKAIYCLACIFLISIFLDGCGEEKYDGCTFTVNVDDQLCHDIEIAKNVAIDIKGEAKAEFLLGEDRNLRIVGVVGHMGAGKTWLINSMFDKNMRTGTLARADEHGLNMLYVPDGSWLIVDMLGSLRKANIATASWEQRIVDQHLVETLRYMIMVQLCHAIIFVIAYPKDYAVFGRQYAQGGLGQIADTHTRVSSMLTQASDISGKDAPVMIVAHNFWSIETETDAKEWFDIAINDFEKNVVLGSQPASTSTSRGLASGLRFQAAFRMESEDIVVANFGFAKDGSRAGNNYNRHSSQAILNELTNLLKTPKSVNILNELEYILRNNLHHIFDGKNEEGDLASLTRDNITIAMEKRTPYDYVLRTTGFPLACKGHIIEAQYRPVPGSLMVKDVKNHADRIIKKQSDTIIEDVAKGRKTRTLHWQMPGISMSDIELIEKDGNIYMTVNERSRRKHSGVYFPVEAGGLPIVFGSGRTHIRLPLDGWSFNILDPKARRLRDGNFTMNMTQEL